MTDKRFIDTNVVIYALGQKSPKKSKALALIKTNPVISTQVLSEMAHTMSRKFHLPYTRISLVVDILSTRCEVALIDKGTLRRAIELCLKYSYSYYDSLILASAIESQCSVLYSEDMHQCQVIDGTLTIVNPFRI
jgi:predicted nucleic acid-binding protein